MPAAAYLVHDFDPFLLRISGNFGLRWYGVAYLAGFVVAGFLLHLYARRGKSLLPAERVVDFMFWIIAGVMVGGRLGYFLLYTPELLVSDPISIFRTWDGGMASHGGFVGVLAGIWYFSRSSRIPLVHLGDLIASAAPAGLFFGRLANFVNGELVGRVTDVRWAVIFPGETAPRHPSQLYQAGLEGLVLLAFVQWRMWKTDVVRTRPGRLAGEFLIAYAVVRAIGELFREPDASMILGLTRGTFYSLFLVVGGLILIARAGRAGTSGKR